MKINYIDNGDEIDERDIDSSLASKNIFTFIVDRSGSMTGEKMEITKESLKLFIQSLPVGSQYQIISFGSRYDKLVIKGQTLFDYTDENVELTKNSIE